jgi:hypothetical protein
MISMPGFLKSSPAAVFKDEEIPDRKAGLVGCFAIE